MKGIYPREPKHKPNKTQTYYHAKDIAYISHEPIIDYFRKMKTFLKKVVFAFPFLASFLALMVVVRKRKFSANGRTSPR